MIGGRLNVGKIDEGYVLDHIPAGKAMAIYRYLQLDESESTVAIIKNARSNEMGKKDILKVECEVGSLDLDVLAFIGAGITVNVIRGGEIVEKKSLALPKEIRGVLRCQNPRCITSTETDLPHIFYLADSHKRIYRCRYCDVKFDEREKKVL